MTAFVMLAKVVCLYLLSARSLLLRHHHRSPGASCGVLGRVKELTCPITHYLRRQCETPLLGGYQTDVYTACYNPSQKTRLVMLEM